MRMLRTCALFIVALAGSTDAASTLAQTATQKKLRVGVRRDVDDSDASTDLDDVDESGAANPAPAPAAAPSAAPVPAPAAIVEQEEVEMRDMMDAASDMLKDHGLSDARTKHKQELAGLMWIQETLEDKLDTMNDESYIKMIEKQEKPVADETSPGLANMLGEMREDMHEYALPFYKKVLKEKIEQLEKEQHQLVLSIADDDKEAEKEEKEPVKKEDKEPEKEKEEIEEAAPAPAKKGKSVGNNTIFIAATAVAILAALAYIFSRRSSTRQ